MAFHRLSVWSSSVYFQGHKMKICAKSDEYGRFHSLFMQHKVLLSAALAVSPSCFLFGMCL